MREAFRQALTEIATKPPSTSLDHRTRQLIQAASGVEAGGHAVPPAELARRVHRARKLGRAWASYTHQAQQAPHHLDVLRTDWTVLTGQLVGLVPPQRMVVLEAFGTALGLDDQPHAEAKRSYLLRQSATRPERFAGLTARAGLPWASPAGYLVHAVEELTACSVVERQQLHAELTAHTAWHRPDVRRVLLEFFSDWLATRFGADNGAAWSDNAAS